MPHGSAFAASVGFSPDLVGRNVAALVKAPQGRSGRLSKSFTLDQAKALLAASEGTRLCAYVVLSLLDTCAQNGPAAATAPEGLFCGAVPARAGMDATCWHAPACLLYAGAIRRLG